MRVEGTVYIDRQIVLHVRKPNVLLDDACICVCFCCFFFFLHFVGTVVTLFMSRSATYGYDQRCEIFGSKGLVSVNNIHETSTGKIVSFAMQNCSTTFLSVIYFVYTLLYLQLYQTLRESTNQGCNIHSLNVSM